jgi:hypothetical protein
VRRGTIIEAIGNLQDQLQELRDVLATHDVVGDDDPAVLQPGRPGVEVHCGRGSQD